MRDLAEIKNILKNFYNISGFRVSIHDIDLNEICSYPGHLTEFCSIIQMQTEYKKMCMQNDAKAFEKVRQTGQVYVYKCQCGLIEAVSPIYHFGVLSGYLMIGQICEEKPDEYRRLFELNRNKFTDEQTARKVINNINSVPNDKIYSYIDIMTIIAEHITNSNKMNSYEENLAPIIREYINLNYRKKISLDILTDRFGCCKSTLLNCFKKEYGTTIFEYINTVRMKQAAEMLKQSNKSIKEIAFFCGISDQNYFSKIFTSYYGCSPSKYRTSKE